MPTLRVDVYTAPPIPWKKPNGQQGGLWSPIACTLIHGAKEAILVDTPITIAQTNDLIAWIKATIPTKRLTKIYITHGHGDHFFGIPTLMKEFPGAEPVATAATVKHMEQQVEKVYFKSGWGIQFPGEIEENFILAKPLPKNNEMNLEDNILKAVEVGQSDTHDSTILWVPSIKLAVCGDVVYGDVHQLLSECNTKAKRQGWIDSIRKVEALKPEIVVPSHKRASEVDGPFHLRNTREYIESFEEFLEGGAKDPRELSKLMTKKYPTRFNPGTLIMSSVGAFKTESKI
ncbi:beta-lactamase-like protein [Leptodontidium sp. 2 PMI_412]|nr:beta-lactamase-like protein [Leptodontidium sp. 2 PMI_412]